MMNCMGRAEFVIPGLTRSDKAILAFQPAIFVSLSATKQRVSRLRDEFALIASAIQLDGAGLTLPLAAGDGGGAVRTAANDFIEAHLPVETVGPSRDDHAKVHQFCPSRPHR